MLIFFADQLFLITAVRMFMAFSFFQTADKFFRYGITAIHMRMAIRLFQSADISFRHRVASVRMRMSFGNGCFRSFLFLSAAFRFFQAANQFFFRTACVCMRMSGDLFLPANQFFFRAARIRMYMTCPFFPGTDKHFFVAVVVVFMLFKSALRLSRHGNSVLRQNAHDAADYNNGKQHNGNTDFSAFFVPSVQFIHILFYKFLHFLHLPTTGYLYTIRQYVKV